MLLKQVSATNKRIHYKRSPRWCSSRAVCGIRLDDVVPCDEILRLAEALIHPR